MFDPKRARSLCSSYCFFLLFVAAVLSSCATLAPQDKKEKDLSLLPVVFFQKYISPVDGNRCRMHPSCSQYAVESIRKHGFLTGWVMTCDRLVRCGRDEFKESPLVVINQEKYCPDPVNNNDFWWTEENLTGVKSP